MKVEKQKDNAYSSFKQRLRMIWTILTKKRVSVVSFDNDKEEILLEQVSICDLDKFVSKMHSKFHAHEAKRLTPEEIIQRSKEVFEKIMKTKFPFPFVKAEMFDPKPNEKKALEDMNLEELQQELKNCEAEQKFERAAVISKLINKLKSNDKTV